MEGSASKVKGRVPLLINIYASLERLTGGRAPEAQEDKEIPHHFQPLD